MKRILSILPLRSGLWTLCAVLLLCAPALAGDPVLHPVSLQLRWRHQFQFAGYYAAQEKGFFKEAGLEAAIAEIKDGMDPVEEVLSGRADFGVGTSSLVLERSKGRPVVVLAAVFQHSPMVILASGETGIKTLKDLEGRRVMLETGSAELLAYMREEGADPGRMILKDHTHGAGAFINGAVEAMSGYSTDEPYMLKTAEVPYLTFSPRDAGIDFYGDVLFTSEEQVRKNPARVRAFLEACRKGWKYAFDNDEELIGIIRARYSGRHTRGHLKFEARQMRALVLPDLVEIGYQTEDRWQHIADTYARMGMLPAPFPVKDMIFQKDVKPNWTLIYSVGGGGLVLLLAVAGVSLRFYRMNRLLKHQMQERDRAEAKARASEERFRRLMEMAPFPMVITRMADSRVIYVNHRAEAKLGMDLQTALTQGAPAVSFYDRPEDRERLKNLLADTGFVEDFETCLRSLTGERFWASLSCVTLEHDGEPCLFSAFNDISELKRTFEALSAAQAQAEDANRTKSDFLARMSHEIRTPMNAIVGMTYLALQTDLTPRQADYLRKVRHAADSLLGIINDILDFSKIEAGRLTIEHIDFHLDEVLETVSGIVGLKAEEKGLELLFAIAPDVPHGLVGDPLRLGQVLINLVTNALKFAETGEVTLRVEVLSGQPPQDPPPPDGPRVVLRFTVTDTGIGMTPEQVAGLFEAFVQADGSTTRKYGGSGLGLVICKRLVELMGGTIGVVSEPGRGSSFFFSVPFGLNQERGFRHLRVEPDMRRLKVLVVDDNASALEVMRSTLASFSFEAVAARSGPQALALLDAAPESDPFRLVILDWKMPRMDGLEVAREIRRPGRLAHEPKILMVTAHGREEVKAQAQGAGVDAFLIKPLNPSVLFDTIIALFSGDSPEDRSAGRENLFEDPGLAGIAGAHVLLAEDNPINQQVATELLERAGLTVRVAANGREAVEAVEREDFELVFMDIQMPVMDGYAATRAIRDLLRTRAGASPGRPVPALPIVAMTAHALTGDREKSLEAGMDDHLTKPINPRRLLDALLRWIPAGERQVPVRPATPAASADPGLEDLPLSLPGLDLEAGLSCVAGNRRLYRQLLMDFVRDYAHTARLIQDTLDAGDPDTAKRQAHTLKSVSGSLGARQVNLVAANMEAALARGDQAAARELLPVLAGPLDLVCAGLAQALPPPGEEAPEPEEDPGSFVPDRAVLAPLFARLATLLRENDMEAGEALNAVRAHLDGHYGHDCGAVQRLIDDLEFAAAEEKLAALARTLDIPPVEAA